MSEPVWTYTGKSIYKNGDFIGKCEDDLSAVRLVNQLNMQAAAPDLLEALGMRRSYSIHPLGW